MDKVSASEQLRSKAKKLEQLAALLEDDEIAAELAGLFPATPIPAPAPNPDEVERAASSAAKKSPATRQKRASKRRRRGLGAAVIDMVRASQLPLTAAAVTDRLETTGYPFGAKNPKVAVSKALRQAAEAKKIDAAKTGDHAKSAIVYSPLAGTSLFPVRETLN
jgi:hypothetical protein